MAGNRPGPVPLPDNVRELNGGRSNSPDRQRDDTAKAKPERPTRPRWLPPAARKEWNRVVPLLERQGTVAKIDQAALAAYCVAVAEIEEATVALFHAKDCEATCRVHGPTVPASRGGTMKNPAWQVFRDAQAVVVRLAPEFGLTPGGRAGLRLPGGGEDDDLDSVLEGRGAPPSAGTAGPGDPAVLS